MTGQQICEHIARAAFLRGPNYGPLLTADQIWNYSPSGELSEIFNWYEQASCILGTFADGSPYIPIAAFGRTGQIYRTGDEIPEDAIRFK